MIKRLQLRMTCLVITVLILVSAGIILAVYLSNEQNIAAQADASLSALLEKSASSFSRADSTGMDGKRDEEPVQDENEARRNGRGNRAEPPDKRLPPEIRNGRDAAFAGLSNSYTILLDEDGSVASWSSERMDLYSDEQVNAMADAILAEEKGSGRIGTQFYRRAEISGRKALLVLDARMEFLSASDTLRSIMIITAIACVLLSLLAWLLIRRMVRPVEDAFTRQKQFVDDASHELKTPLAVISANAEVLEQEIGENEHLGYIRSEVRRTDSLVRNLLTLARLDRNGMKVEMKSFDLSRALLSVILPFESTVYEAGKTLETDIPEGIACFGNEEMIQQLAVILLSNALKYSGDGGRISIRLTARGKLRELRVFNTGLPIDPKDRERIFDRFWRADPAHNRDSGGHGLGLAIASSVVKFHRGKISVESNESGNTFTVILSA